LCGISVSAYHYGLFLFLEELHVRLFSLLLSCCFLLVNCQVTSPENSASKSTESSIPHIDSGKKPGEKSDENSLHSYLTKPYSDSAVRRLALLGAARYLDPATGLMARRQGKPNKAGRGKDWIKETFEQDENEIIQKLKNEPAPKTWTLEEIDHAYQNEIKKHQPDSSRKKAQFILVKGVSINHLHEAPLSHDSFVQLASQFNFLESMGAYPTPVSEYLNDSTQGPQGSIEAAAAALLRTAAVEDDRLPNALSKVLPHDHDKYYKYGYLMLYELNEAELQLVYNHIKTNLQKLTILPQWVINEASGSRQIQVFSAAPSYQGSTTPAAESLGGKLCALLVAAQYEAIAKLAVMRSLLINGPVALHLTLVGQGAFHNPPEVMHEAFKNVAEIVKGYPHVHVYVHGYNGRDQIIIRNQVDKNLIDLTEMDENVFMTAHF
jgi:hypothetical protein